MRTNFFRQLTAIEPVGKHGLLLFEWVMLAYAAFTLLLMALSWRQLQCPWPMLGGRLGAVGMTLVLWLAYRWRPCRLTMMLRVALQLALLSWWYPDTYELNRHCQNLDHVFAGLEQSVFGCQPALFLHEKYSSPVVSELLSLGYVSYFPMIATVALYYFCQQYDRFLRTSFIILASFFLFYVIFIFLPVVGPQFYYQAVGTDLIGQGVFPDLGRYFVAHQESLPIPGHEGGLFHNLLLTAHAAGERPTAAFPSSHVGVTTLLLWLAFETRSRWLFWSLVPLAVLMFFATFYVQAHYAIDAVAGLLVGTGMYFLLRWAYDRLARLTHLQ